MGGVIFYFCIRVLHYLLQRKICRIWPNIKFDEDSVKSADSLGKEHIFPSKCNIV